MLVLRRLLQASLYSSALCLFLTIEPRIPIRARKGAGMKHEDGSESLVWLVDGKEEPFVPVHGHAWMPARVDRSFSERADDEDDPSGQSMKDDDHTDDQSGLMWV